MTGAAGELAGERRYGEWVVVRHDAAHPHVAELVLDRPRAMNALSAEFSRRLAEACADLAGEPGAGVRAVVLSSTHPRAFCVGADLKERNQLDDEGLARQREVMREAFGGLLGLPMPAIAAVHGYALGGGLELALSCDLIIADPGSELGLPEVSVGVVPGGGGTQLLPRRVGAARAAELIFTARRVTAAEALGLGLVDRLAARGEARAEAFALADRAAAHSPVAVRAAKRALRAAWGLPLEQGLQAEDAAWRDAAFSADRAEGVAAFNEKRPPRWPGV